MYCNNCGKKVDEDSKFCQFCGARVDKANDSKPKAESEKQKEEAKETETKSKVDQLWDKFAEVYDAQDKERERYDALSSALVSSLTGYRFVDTQNSCLGWFVSRVS